jgi:two-component system, OmpR family, KDP operon response regulator KdpE
VTTVLIVDDDPRSRQELRIALNQHGYDVATVADGATALRVGAHIRPDVIVLEPDLPELDGTAVIAALRGRITVPIIVIARHTTVTDEATDEATDMVRALDAGADDYVTKPFEMAEFLARLRAMLRRAVPASGAAELRVVDAGEFIVDLAAKKVWREGSAVRLTPTEWALLEVLIRQRGDLVTHRQLLTEVWGPDHLADIHYLHVYMAQLRRKLESQPARPRHLITEPGRGFRFRIEPA